MATAVLDLDASEPLHTVTGLGRYDRAVVLLRYKTRPIARVELEVVDGCIPVERLQQAMGPHGRYQCHQRRIWELLDWTDKPFPARLPTATVAVCTRDRPEDLVRCLEGISRLVDDGQDVLVVDNCPSTDASRDVVARFPGVRYAREPRPGLDHARNCALREATGEIIAFIDDDATPDPLWLRSLLLNFDGPNVVCVTGLTMPLELEAPAQEQFEHYSTFSRGFARRIFTAGWHDPLSVGHIGSGTNMSFRRDLLTRVGGFDNALDAGTPTNSGGDHEMFSRILTAGYRIKYEPAALNWHRHRRTYAELEKTIYGYGVGVYSAFIRALLWEREIGVFRVAYYWLHHDQARKLYRALRRRKNAKPLGLVLAELRGCLAAPRAYWRSVQRLKATGGPRNV